MANYCVHSSRITIASHQTLSQGSGSRLFLVRLQIVTYILYMGQHAHFLCARDRWTGLINHWQVNPPPVQSLPAFGYIYSASRQESKFFELLFFEVKWASLCLITSTDIIKITFIVFLHFSLSPYIANREAAQVQAVFEPFFTNLGQKWQYLKSTLELNLQIWESETLIQVHWEAQVDFLNSKYFSNKMPKVFDTLKWHF